MAVGLVVLRGQRQLPAFRRADVQRRQPRVVADGVQVVAQASVAAGDFRADGRSEVGAGQAVVRPDQQRVARPAGILRQRPVVQLNPFRLVVMVFLARPRLDAHRVHAAVEVAEFGVFIEFEGIIQIDLVEVDRVTQRVFVAAGAPDAAGQTVTVRPARGVNVGTACGGGSRGAAQVQRAIDPTAGVVHGRVGA